MLGSNKTPNFQGMFLRGAGSQSFTQDNGDLNETGNNTVYSSGSIGSIQGDGMRRLYGGAGPFQFTNPNNIEYGIYGNYMKFAGVGGSHELGFGSSGSVGPFAPIPYMEYSLSGDPESGYTLSSSINYFEGISTLTEYSDSTAWTTMWVGWDSSWAAPTANEIRPVNIAVKYYIRAK